MRPDPAAPFHVGQHYTRAFISSTLGGDIHSYLPTSAGQVVCGCFKLCPTANPGAPETITFGAGPVVRRQAERVHEQGGSIPVFVFRDHNEWVYQGRYQCVGLTFDAAAVKAAMDENPDRGEIVGILYFDRVSD